MKIAITDYSFPSLEIEEAILLPQGYELVAWKEKRSSAEIAHWLAEVNPAAEVAGGRTSISGFGFSGSMVWKSGEDCGLSFSEPTFPAEGDQRYRHRLRRGG